MATITNVQSLQGQEAKIEAERCVAEAVMTRWLYATMGNFRWTYAQEALDIPIQTRSFHAHKDFALGRYHNTFSYEEIMSFEDMPWWLCMILKGGPGQRTGVTTGSTPPGFAYVSVPSSSVDDLDSFTMKFWEPSNIYTIDRVMCNSATFAFDAVNNPAWVMTLDLMGRLLTSGSSYDAVADRTRHIIRAAGTKVYIDEPGGVIGTTQVLGKLRSGSITIDNQIETKQFSEDALTDACDVGRGEQLVTGELVIEFKDDSEFAKMRSGTARKLRFEAPGEVIGTTPDTTYLWQVDIPVAHWMAPTMDYAGQNKIQTFGFMGYTDATSPQPISIKTVNALATIAA
jgi:hypothetical protein